MGEERLESKRWGIAIAAVIMQLSLGTVYAWSVFKKPLMAAHGWGETETQVTFMICIGMIGIAAAFGGALVDKKGPRFVATLGGILFGIGTLLAGLADAIVDLVSTGSTLKANNLVACEHIMDISSRLIVNQAALKLKRETLAPILDAIAGVIEK